MTKDTHEFHGDRQYLEPLAVYLQRSMAKMGGAPGTAMTAHTFGAQLVDFYIIITMEMLIQHGVDPSIQSLAAATRLPQEDISKHVDSMLRAGVLQESVDSISQERRLLRRGGVDKHFGARAEDSTIKMFKKYWGEDIEEELRSRYLATTGRCDDKFSIAPVSAGMARRLGIEGKAVEELR